jgi:Domain of unknown function (DUF222)/HNH endonuclease
MCSSENDRLADEITELASHIHAATCRWLGLVAEFDRRGGWGEWGCRSCAHWISWRCSISSAAAREHVRVALRLQELPRVRGAFAEGRLSYSQVRALTRVAKVVKEEELLSLARHATAAQLERMVRAYCGVVARARAAEDGGPERYVTWEHADDGSLLLRARLPAEEGAVVLAALEAGVTCLAEGVSAEAPEGEEGVSAETPSLGERRADTLVLMADTLLSKEPNARGGERYQVVVHVDSAALRDREADSELADGTPLPAETARRIACDAAIVPLIERAGRPLSVGRKTRSVPPALRRALSSRDRGCRFPGCTNHRTVDAHHIEHWANGGATSLENLVQLCRHHHRLLHEGGYSVTKAGANFVFRRPDGREIRPIPRKPPGCTRTLRETNGHAGRPIDPEATVTLWAGERLDLALNVDALLTFAPPEAPGI